MLLTAILGNVYIADSGNIRIRKITVLTGTITTIAGRSQSTMESRVYTRFSGDGGVATSALINPTGVALDSAGNIYIADYGNNRVRKITASTGIITTVAGSKDQDYWGDGGVATSAAMNYVCDVDIDSEGNFYLSDNQNDRIRKVTLGGTYYPTPIPSNLPTIAPSAPTVTPTMSPSTAKPTYEPTISPSYNPTMNPSILPTSPTVTPTLIPSSVPSISPIVPTIKPTTPTMQPSVVPTIYSSAGPSIAPRYILHHITHLII